MATSLIIKMLEKKMESIINFQTQKMKIGVQPEQEGCSFHFDRSLCLLSAELLGDSLAGIVEQIAKQLILLEGVFCFS